MKPTLTISELCNFKLEGMLQAQKNGFGKGVTVFIARITSKPRPQNQGCWYCTENYGGGKKKLEKR